MASKVDAFYEKGHSVAATTKAVPDERGEPADVETLHLKPSHDITRATWRIVIGVALPCIPIVVVTTVLLYFIFRHRLIISPGWPELQIKPQANHENASDLLNLIREQGGDKAYYVQYNASTITTIASWTGRVIPYLSSSIMALVAFYAARHIVLKSKHGDGTDLPSPQQLTILISVLGGSGFGPLKDTVLYRYFKKERLKSPLPASFTALFIITILGLLIPILDSWFGIATKTVTITQLYPRESILRYGRGLSASVCPHGPATKGYYNCYYDKTAFWPCNMIAYCNGVPRFQNVSDAIRTSLDVSQVNEVNNYTDSYGTLYHYLTDPAQNSTIDYKASTIAVSSQCIPMTEQCYTDSGFLAGTDRFRCTPKFSGNLYNSQLNASATDDFSSSGKFSTVGVAFSRNPQLTQAGGMDLGGDPIYHNDNFTFSEIYPTNPLYYGAWAVGYPPADVGSTEAFLDDPGVYYEDSDLARGGIWMLNCSVAVYDVSYTWINGEVHTFNHTHASPDLAALLSASVAMAPWTGMVQNSLTSVAVLAGTANNSHTIAGLFADGVSKVLLAYSIGALTPVLNEFEQGRDPNVSVARIPMIPLYILIGTKIIYVIAVIVLAIGAYCFTHPAETEFVKAQLSVQGLAAAHFQQPDLAQQNAVKELQQRIDIAKGKASESPPPFPTEEGPIPEKGIARAATDPVHGSEYAHAPPENARVGILPGADGTWQFVMVANGVWNSIKPIVQNLVVADADNGGLGNTGAFIRSW